METETKQEFDTAANPTFDYHSGGPSVAWKDLEPNHKNRQNAHPLRIADDAMINTLFLPELREMLAENNAGESVSYTHLTLPTICSV